MGSLLSFQTDHRSRGIIVEISIKTSYPEEVGHAPNCIMVEAVNQSGARIFLRVKMEEIVAQGMKRISLRVFSALTNLVMYLLTGEER